MKLGDTIRRLRKEQHLSQADLGKKIKIPQTTISDWENDKYLPNVVQAAELAKALNSSVEELLEKHV